MARYKAETDFLPMDPPGASLPPSSPGPLDASTQAARETNRAAMSALWEQESAGLKAKARQGSHWFYWIAALSLINTLVVLFQGNVSFLAGLGVTQIVDAVSSQSLGAAGPYVSVITALLAAALLCVFGFLAGRGSRTALIIGMVLYALDGGLFLFFGDYLPAAFHGFVLFRLWQGWRAWQEIARLRAESTGFAGAVDAPPTL